MSRFSDLQSTDALGTLSNSIELTVFTKAGGPLTKRISLAANGSIVSDGSACTMMKGEARRVKIAGIDDLATLIERLRFDQAIALGTLRPDLPDEVTIVTKDKINGQERPDLIARTNSDIVYQKGRRAFVLFDYDMKGMPPEVADKIAALGGFWSALCSVMPELASAAHVVRKSTSAGLRRTDTGQEFAGSGGLHAYVEVEDGADAVRFLSALHERCWLHGLGWMMVGVGGQLLERSIVDRMVGASERLVFEGAPVLDPPLAQDAEARRPMATDGEAIDTVRACPTLTLVEQQALRKLRAESRQRLLPEIHKAREAYVAQRAQQLAERTGMAKDEAAHLIERQCQGILLAGIELPFDDPELSGTTVNDVLDDPARFEGMTLADPMEGVDYGRCKAKVMRGADGTPWINSFAHGRTTYRLKYDAGAVRTRIERAHDPIDALVRLALSADLDEVETKQLIDLVVRRTGAGVREVTAKLKAAKREHGRRRAAEMHERQLAERLDPRPSINVPAQDAPWLPQMQVINETIGHAPRPLRVRRDIDGDAARMRKFRVPNMHAFTQEQPEGQPTTELPPPEQWAIVKMSECELAEAIETFIDYVDKDGRSVHLPTPFVRHFMKRDDDALPTIVAIATSPIVQADGNLLAFENDIVNGIGFAIPKEIMALLPRREDCADSAVKKAMEFLTDDWLGDVSTDYNGKCTLIAAALTLIERSLVPDRPAFFVTAGRRGSGKTTALTMLVVAVTGIRPAAAAWSTNEEERRKALLSYFLSGVSYIIWDNIVRGTKISCAHVEKSCTSAFYADHRLGVSEVVATAASTIHLFTGNNIGPRGDLASRSLSVRLEADRADPENREYKHPDVIGWTEDNRAEILKALYTILLGNPTLKEPQDAQMKTRYKRWWRLVGSAVENAAKEAGQEVDFQKLFLEQDDEDEDDASLSAVLAGMRNKWPGGFKASDVSNVINSCAFEDAGLGGDIRELLYPAQVSAQAIITPKSVGKRLKNHVGDPVRCGDETLALKTKKDNNEMVYYIKATKNEE
jgi:hypothetical protein